MDEYKVLIDTDVGDDIDDAFALLLAAKSNELDVVAVTTVFRNTVCRAKQVSKLTAVLGKSIPVYAGEGLPLSKKIPPFFHDKDEDLLQTKPCQYDQTMDDFTVGGDAVGAIIDFADKYDGELTVVTIGAMTNLAKAIERNPDVVGKIKEVVAMGGWFTNFLPEWNVICDPEAFQTVISSGLNVRFVGLDVTLKCTLDDKLLDDFRNSNDNANRLVVSWLDKWFETFKFEKSVMHDPLAVASVFTDVCKFEKLYAKVVLDGEKRGAVQVEKQITDGFYPVYAAYSVDKDKFYDTIRAKLLN